MSFGSTIGQVAAGPGGRASFGQGMGYDDPNLPSPDGTTPGLGGKGPLSQIPVDMQGNILGTSQPAQGLPQNVFKGMPGGTTGEILGPDVIDTGSSAPGVGGKGGAQYGATQQLPADNNLPQPPAAKPLGSDLGGTPGRPVPAAPMTPRGVGFANPGAPGAPQQNSQPVGPASRPPLIGNSNPDTYFNRYAQQLGLPQRPLTGNFQPRPVGNLSPQPLGKPPVVGQITKPNKGIGTSYGPLIRGAGRGGILR